MIDHTATSNTYFCDCCRNFPIGISVHRSAKEKRRTGGVSETERETVSFKNLLSSLMHSNRVCSHMKRSRAPAKIPRTIINRTGSKDGLTKEVTLRIGRSVEICRLCRAVPYGTRVYLPDPESSRARIKRVRDAAALT